MSGRSRSGAPHGGAGAGVFLAIVSVLVGGGSLLVWIAGAIGGVAAGGGPVLVSLSDAGTVLAELPSHLNDPARAWPAAVRDELPKRTTMLAALIVTPRLASRAGRHCAVAAGTGSTAAARRAAGRPAGRRPATCAACASRDPSAAA